ncbi:MAG: exodeoxyribonuclease VII large subunit [Candidatus Krumholzibacteriota bacterium]|nr:exodeoxyribonuclease VII large subunit [Candidatus Krumholzibacteriota bacterium]
MSPQPDLFDEPRALRVSEFNERVGAGLRVLFPGVFRIQGFVTGFQRSWRRGGHVYFELEERDPADPDRSLAKIAAVLWRGLRARLQADVAVLGGPEGALDDQQLFLEVSVNWWAQGGRLSLQVESIDVEASLGAQRLDRERVLRLLTAEGLLDRNRSLALPAVPLRLGLITSLESAAYHDFLKELGLAGVGFRVLCRDARVQGPEQEGDMLAALASLGRRAAELDALVLIRGGGSRSDLQGFDSEGLARAIAASPLPVLTGIGHEIDRSIADEVAHTALKTPTAVAQFLVQRVEDWLAGMEALARELRLEAARRLERAGRGLEGQIHRLRMAGGERLGRERARLGARAATLPAAARHPLRLARPGLAFRAERLARTARSPLSLAAADLVRRASGLPRLAAARLAGSRRELDHGAERLRLLDPARVLERGFSITRDGRGRLLRAADQVAPGEILMTRLAGGRVDSRVEQVRIEEDGGAAGHAPPGGTKPARCGEGGT